jgi:hypothetical protein
MVGPGRLELPTPRLSSVCSNQLSYGPGQGPVIRNQGADDGSQITGNQNVSPMRNTQQGQSPTPVVRRPVRSTGPIGPYVREDRNVF